MKVKLNVLVRETRMESGGWVASIEGDPDAPDPNPVAPYMGGGLGLYGKGGCPFRVGDTLTLTLEAR